MTGDLECISKWPTTFLHKQRPAFEARHCPHETSPMLVRRFNFPRRGGRTAGERERQERVEQWNESPKPANHIRCILPLRFAFLRAADIAA